MIKKLRFNLTYFLLSILIFGIEVLIATVLKDWFWVRSYLGDVIVVGLLYTLVLSFYDINRIKLIIGIALFSVGVEFLQYFKIADFLGFNRGSFFHIIIGNSFSWLDIVCYIIGCLGLYFIQKLK